MSMRLQGTLLWTCTPYNGAAQASNEADKLGSAYQSLLDAMSTGTEDSEDHAFRLA